MSEKEEQKTIGLTEDVEVYSIDKSKKRKVKARIDTGAHSNSVDSKLAASLNLGPVVKTTVVKSANGESLRPVVKMKININGKEMSGLFTIADRSKMKYRVLIGRNILSKSGFLIDPKRG
ncbi:MAG: RimK/LysX family protein [Nanoarchaeota archaeon]